MRIFSIFSLNISSTYLDKYRDFVTNILTNYSLSQYKYDKKCLCKDNNNKIFKKYCTLAIAFLFIYCLFYNIIAINDNVKSLIRL